MTVEVEVAVELSGKYVVGELYRLSLDVPGSDVRLGVPRALYLAYARDGSLHYVGKVNRQAGSVGQRLREHTRASARKRTAWRWL